MTLFVSLAAPLLTALLMAQSEAPRPPPPAPSAPEFGALGEPTAPPLLPLPPPAETRRSSAHRGAARASPPPEVGDAGAVLFSPLSLFGLFFSLEVEYAFFAQLSAYGALGAGAFAQLAGEGGFRAYPVERALDNVFVELHGQFFAAPLSGMVLIGPGTMLGLAWKSKSGEMLSSAGVGVNVWFEASSPSTTFLGARPAPSGFLFLPGLQVPPLRGSAAQLTVRFCLGPLF